MHRVARWLPFALLLSCAPTENRPVQIGTTIVMPQALINLGRLDNQMHLRIFPRGTISGTFACDVNAGQVTRDGVRVVDYAGGNVNPAIRCDPATWAPMRQMLGEAAPVDQCFDRTATTSIAVDVQAGSYIVLVEGSGMSSTGTMRRIILGSGCAEITPTAGQQLPVTILMQEQVDRGVCHDSDVALNESCDTGAETPACDHCQFPEMRVNTTTTMPRNPAVTWAPAQRMVIGFFSNDNVYVHEFDEMGMPITSSAVLGDDNVMAVLQRNVQDAIRLSSNATGYAAVWEDQSRPTATFDTDARGTFSSYDAPPPPPPDAIVNVTSMAPMQDRKHPSVAVSASRAAFVFEDVTTGTIRVASTTASAPFVAPTADAPLVAAGGMGTTGAIFPVIATTSSGFTVAWAARGGSDLDVFAAQLDAMGTPMGAPIRVNSETGGDQDQVTLAATANDVVIAWRDASHADPTDNQGTTIRWRHFGAGLAPDGNDRIAPTTVAGDQIAPAIAVAPSGMVLIAWEDASGQIRGRQFNLAGVAQLSRLTGADADFEIEAAAGSTSIGMGPRHTPWAAFGGAGRFAVVWQDQGLGQIRMRTLRAD